MSTPVDDPLGRERAHLSESRSALRAIRVFAGAAFDVVILGEFAEEAGVRRR